MTEAKIAAFIGQNFLDGEEVPVDAPLLEWGILTSLNTMMLVTYLREEFGVHVSPLMLNEENFAAVTNIAALVDHLSNGKSL